MIGEIRIHKKDEVKDHAEEQLDGIRPTEKEHGMVVQAGAISHNTRHSRQ